MKLKFILKEIIYSIILLLKEKLSILKAQVLEDLYLKKIQILTFADKSDVLIKKIFGETGPFTISDGDLKINFNSQITISSNFDTSIKYTKKTHNLKTLQKKFKFLNTVPILEAKAKNEFGISLDKTYKLDNYLFKSNGKIFVSEIEFQNPLKNDLLKSEINNLYLKNINFITNIDPKSNAKVEGEYSTNNKNF